MHFWPFRHYSNPQMQIHFLIASQASSHPIFKTFHISWKTTMKNYKEFLQWIIISHLDHHHYHQHFRQVYSTFLITTYYYDPESSLPTIFHHWNFNFDFNSIILHISNHFGVILVENGCSASFLSARYCHHLKDTTVIKLFAFDWIWIWLF